MNYKFIGLLNIPQDCKSCGAGDLRARNGTGFNYVNPIGYIPDNTKTKIKEVGHKIVNFFKRILGITKPPPPKTTPSF